MSEPRASRPHMPGYGILPADEGGGLLPWSWAEERLRSAKNYWLSTARPGDRPHAMPVWAVWLDGALFFSTGSDSRKARNLQRSPSCVMTTESADEAVIVEGRATLERDPPEPLPAIYLGKYGMSYPDDSSVYRVEPITVFGFIETDSQFQARATRWQF